MYDILDKLIDQIPRDKVNQGKVSSSKYLEENLKEINRLQYMPKFKYDDFDKLLEKKNIIKIKAINAVKYVEEEIKDADMIPLSDGVKIPIENSVIAIFDNGGDNNTAYFYSETACNKTFVYIYILIGERVVPFVCLIIKMKSGNITCKYHKNIINSGYVCYEKQDPRVTVLFDYFLAANLYIKNSMENRKTIYRKKKTSKNSKNGNKTSNYTYNKNKIIVLNSDKVVYEVETNSTVQEFKRTYVRHADSWTVRSFERHYKSGKVVTIKEHTRGNKASKAKKNVYTIK